LPSGHSGDDHFDCVRGFAGQGQYQTLMLFPPAFRIKAPFSSAKGISSSDCVFADE
jgi:hypothetical protein